MGRLRGGIKSGGRWKDLGPKFSSAITTRRTEELQLLPLKLHNCKLSFTFAGSLFECQLRGLSGAAFAVAKVIDAE